METRNAYREGVALIADNVLLTATTWSDLTSTVEEFAQGWGMSTDTVGDDVLAAMAARFTAATA